MKNRLNTAVRVLAAAAAMAVATGASAQSAGTWMAKVGVNKITPHVDSGDVSAPALPGTKADVKSDTKPILTFAYMITDNISAEMILGVPYKHDLIGAHRNGLGAQRTDLVEHAMSGLFVRLEVDANAIALASRQQCRRGANPTTAPGDDEDFVHAYALLNQPNV